MTEKRLAAEGQMTRITITLPDALLSDVDAKVGPRGRSGFFARAARSELVRERRRMALDAARGTMVGMPGWRSSEENIRHVDGLRSGDRDGDTTRSVRRGVQ